MWGGGRGQFRKNEGWWDDLAENNTPRFHLVLQPPPHPPTSTHPFFPATTPPRRTHTRRSDQIKLKPDGAGPGLCVVSDCHGALTMISHWDALPGQKKKEKKQEVRGGRAEGESERDRGVEKEMKREEEEGVGGCWWIRPCCQQINPTDRTAGTGRWCERHVTWRQACDGEARDGSVLPQIGPHIRLNPNPIIISLTSASHLKDDSLRFTPRPDAARRSWWKAGRKLSCTAGDFFVAVKQSYMSHIWRFPQKVAIKKMYTCNKNVPLSLLFTLQHTSLYGAQNYLLFI